MLWYGYKERSIYNMFHVLCNGMCRDNGIKTHFQDDIYLLSLRVHCTKGAHILALISLHKFLSYLLHILHATIYVWCLLGQLKLCIRLKGVSLSADDLRIWVHWWLHMLLINKMPLEMKQQFISRSSEVVNPPFKARCVMRHA